MTERKKAFYFTSMQKNVLLYINSKKKHFITLQCKKNVLLHFNAQKRFITQQCKKSFYYSVEQKKRHAGRYPEKKIPDDNAIKRFCYTSMKKKSILLHCKGKEAPEDIKKTNPR